MDMCSVQAGILLSLSFVSGNYSRLSQEFRWTPLDRFPYGASVIDEMGEKEVSTRVYISNWKNGGGDRGSE